MPDDSVDFTLLENGLDFIWSAVEHLDVASTKRDLKYATLHLVSGIELVLKERVRREDWTLLFPDPSKADLKTYERGAFRSIGFDECLILLESESYVEFTDDELVRLRTIRDKRNRLEHLTITDSPEAIIASAVEALEVIVDFIREHLADVALNAGEEGLLAKIRTKLGNLEAFVDARQKSLAPKLADAYAILPCPACLQDALSVDDGVKCLFCGYATSADDAADAYAAHVVGTSRFRYEKDGGIWPILLCPSCRWDTCVAAHEQGHLCFGCGGKWALGDLEECGRCGGLVEEGDAICSRCLDDVASRDD